MTLGDSWNLKAASSTQESKNFWIIFSESSLTVSFLWQNGAAETIYFHKHKKNTV